MHGGLSPDLQSMEQIRRVMRPTDVPDTGAFTSYVVCGDISSIVQDYFVTFYGQTQTKTLLGGQKTIEASRLPLGQTSSPDFYRNTIWTSSAEHIRHASATAPSARSTDIAHRSWKMVMNSLRNDILSPCSQHRIIAASSTMRAP